LAKRVGFFEGRGDVIIINSRGGKKTGCGTVNNFKMKIGSCGERKGGKAWIFFAGKNSKYQ